jgi:hypothetical protein
MFLVLFEMELATQAVNVHPKEEVLVEIALQGKLFVFNLTSG